MDIILCTQNNETDCVNVHKASLSPIYTSQASNILKDPNFVTFKQIFGDNPRTWGKTRLNPWLDLKVVNTIIGCNNAT